MTRLGVVLSAIAFGTFALGAAASLGPALRLTAIPDVATVYWRYDCSTKRPVWALGLTLDRNTATTGVHLRQAGAVTNVTMQPGQTRWFRFSHATRRTLTTAESTEPGTLRAVLTVDFGFPHSVPHCWPYAAPRLTLQVYPR